ncbi:translation initiation factor IF-2 N-terminal domain-containing protein [Amycolatopsis sp. NPDC051372]|uniref:translation initiation factor IF-2 N-terminal domain-containing protein n=1 Tax=Amycolatopsis sp. NPDC051372 TaxID=3155669 RepID=UPI003449A48E
MKARVHELAKELGVSAQTVLARLADLGVYTRSASSTVDPAAARRLRDSFGYSDEALRVGAATARQSSWMAGEIRPPTNPEVLRKIEELKQVFPVAAEHDRLLRAVGSSFFYASPCRISGFEECWVALVRFSGAIESAFGLTREVMFFYSPHRDFQNRTFRAAKDALRRIRREVSPDILFFWSSDERMRVKLEDWTAGDFLAIPLDLDPEENSIALVSLLRDFIFARDLFYETTPVRGDRFFGRKRLLQSLRDDIERKRVSGIFGLRKAGKTSVLSELIENLSSDNRIFVLRDLEHLPSPPDDPVPDLLRDLIDDISAELKIREQSAIELTRIANSTSVSEFKRALQKVLRRLDSAGIFLVIMLDEIEYLTPSDRIDIAEGNMSSVAQLLGALRSLVQENENFTFLLSGLTSAIVESGRLYGRPNPLFSWAKSNFLAPFDRHEADDLAKSVGSKMGISIDEAALEALYDASGGHAFLYRHLASSVVKKLPVDVFHRRLTRPDVLRSIEEWRGFAAGNMREMLDHIKRYYPDEAYLIQILREDPDVFSDIANDEPQALGHLISLGLINKIDYKYELTPVLELL